MLEAAERLVALWLGHALDTSARRWCQRSPRKAEAEAPRERRDERGRGAGLATFVLGRVLRDERAADERAADVAERLRREELAAGSTIASRVRSSRRSRARRARISPPRYDGPTPFPVKPNPWWTRPRLPKIGRRVGETSIGPPQACVTARPRSCGKKRTHALARAGDDTADFVPAWRARRAVEPHRAAAPAERDAAVARRAGVVDERPAVDDRLAARPAELLEHVGHGLGEDDVAGGDGERQPVAGEAAPRRS